jgi:hypothetical protein
MDYIMILERAPPITEFGLMMGQGVIGRTETKQMKKEILNQQLGSSFAEGWVSIQYLVECSSIGLGETKSTEGLSRMGTCSHQAHLLGNCELRMWFTAIWITCSRWP